MKRIILGIMLMAIMINGLFAQRQPIHWIGRNVPILNWVGLNGSISTCKLIRYGGKIDDGIKYYEQIGFLVGIKYLRIINDKFAIETGLDFSRNSFKYSYINQMGLEEYSADPENVDLFSIPVNLKVNFKKFSIKGGIQYDRSVSEFTSRIIDNQEGMGINLGIGKDFYISDGFIVFASPVIIFHNIIPFHTADDQQRLTELGIKIDFKYGF